MWNNPFRHKNYTLYAFVILILTFFISKISSADPRQMDKVRSFYKSHGMDFFGDLISTGNSFDEDEKRHAKIELLADDARVRALKQLESLLKTARGTMRSELLLRKASLLSERAQTATYFQNNPFKAKNIGDPKSYLGQSIDNYKIFEKEFAGHPKMDVVLFSIAYNYGELRKTEPAFEYYSKLISKFPESPLIGDARLARSEIYFEKRKFNDSLKDLSAIVKSEHPRLKNFALYKMAWSYYNLGDIESGMTSLERVVDGVNKLGVGGARLELRKEALHDLVGFFAEKPGNGIAETATEYFSTIAKTPDAIVAEVKAIREKRLKASIDQHKPIADEDQDAYQLTEPQDLLFRLVSVYRDQGKHEQSIVVAGQILNQIPHHPKSVALYRLRAEGFEKLRKRGETIQELDRLAQTAKKDIDVIDQTKDGLPEFSHESLESYFASLASKWFEPQKIKFNLPKEIQIKDESSKSENSFYTKNLKATAFETFRDFSKFYHGEWNKTSQKETAQIAKKTYEMAFNTFVQPWRGNNLKDCLELVSNKASLLYAMNLFDNAAQDFHFLAVHTLNEKDRINAIKSEIAALENLSKELKIQVKKEDDMHPIHARLLRAYDAYLAADPSRAEILAASARLLAEYKKSEQALYRMQYYTFNFSKEKDAYSLVKDILSLYENSSRWIDLKNYSEKLLDNKVYEKSATENDLRHSCEFASLRILEDLEKNKDWKNAAKEFAIFAEKNPKSSFVPQAMLKSAQAAIELGDTELSIERLEKATTVSDSKTALQAWLTLEPYYRRGFHYSKLENAYHKILELKPDKKTEATTQANLKAVNELKNQVFMSKQDFFVASDPELKTWTSMQEKVMPKWNNYFELRFLKSNNNPANNFKKKATLQADLLAEIEKVSSKAPQNFRSSALLWTNVMKALVLHEFAETMRTAALPSILKTATQEDVKAYQQTLESQYKELFETSKKQILDSRELATKLEEPDNRMLEKVNQALEKIGESTILVRQDFSKVWNERPAQKPKSESLNLKKADALLHQILTEKKEDAVLKAKLELSELYFHASLYGQSYAVLSDIISSKNSEYSKKALQLEFSIDLLRFQEKLQKAIASNTLDANQRWDLARWLLSRQDFFEDKKDRQWFELASDALLKSSQGQNPLATESNRKLSFAQ